MSFNKLRRAIEQELSASYDTPARKIAEQAHLLTKALMALGGNVGEKRLPEMTVPSTPQQVDGHNDALGRDLGDENDTPHAPSEAEMLDLGRPVVDPSEYSGGFGSHDLK